MTSITLQLIKKPAIYGIILLFAWLPLLYHHRNRNWHSCGGYLQFITLKSSNRPTMLWSFLLLRQKEMCSVIAVRSDGRTDRESGENNRSKNFCSPHQHRPRYGRRCRNDAQNNPLLRAPPMGVRINTRLLSMSCPWGVTSMQAKGEGLLTSPHAGSRERQNGLGWSKSVPFSRGEVDGQLLRLCLCSLHLWLRLEVVKLEGRPTNIHSPHL